MLYQHGLRRRLQVYIIITISNINTITTIIIISTQDRPHLDLLNAVLDDMPVTRGVTAGSHTLTHGGQPATSTVQRLVVLFVVVHVVLQATHN